MEFILSYYKSQKNKREFVGLIGGGRKMINKLRNYNMGFEEWRNLKVGF